MASAEARTRLPLPEVSYSSGLSKNIELVLGPWFVLLGGFISVQLFFFVRADLRPDQPPPPGLRYVAVLFFVMGLVLCYFAYFRGVCRLEIQDETLYWFVPFRRLKSQAPIADIVAIRTGRTWQWGRSRTAIDLRNGRTVSVNDGRGISAFVFDLVARSPDINVADWKAREPRNHYETMRSSYVNDDD
jgi:hypothetical protein